MMRRPSHDVGKLTFVFVLLSVVLCGTAYSQTQLTREQLAKAGVDPDAYLQQQKATTEFVATPEWGTAANIALRVPAADFTPRIGAPAVYGSGGGGQRYRAPGSDQYFDAAVHLPTGAKVTGIRADYCDNNANADITVWFQRVSEPTGGTFLYDGPTSSGSPGCALMFLDLTPQNIVVDNLTQSYWVRVDFGSVTDPSLEIRGAVIFYKLQVSPAPAVATFSDVPTTHPFFQYVEAMAASGLTGGCAPGVYCINDPVTRGQMAVFLSRALGLHFAN